MRLFDVTGIEIDTYILRDAKKIPFTPTHDQWNEKLNQLRQIYHWDVLPSIETKWFEKRAGFFRTSWTWPLRDIQHPDSSMSYLLAKDKLGTNMSQR